MNNFYKDCKLQYFGAVVEIEIKPVSKDFILVLPKPGKFYRYHFSGEIKDEKNGFYKISLDTQKISEVAFSDIVTILHTTLENLKLLLKL